ncbi:MAG TPA: hypothetical protein EYP04_13165, partial [Anaerolineae bacterium]|nr:hypothetical protein [Anaerolineae bacterium]
MTKGRTFLVSLVFLLIVVLLSLAKAGRLPGPKPEPTPRPLATVPLPKRAGYFKQPPPMIIKSDQQYQATLTTDKGEIVIELFAK